MSNMPIHDRRTGIVARAIEHLTGKAGKAAPTESRPRDIFDSSPTVNMSPKEKSSQMRADNQNITGLSSHVNTLGKLGVSDHHVTTMTRSIEQAASAHRMGDHNAASGHLANVTSMLADARQRHGGPFGRTPEAHDIAGKIDRTISTYDMNRHDLGPSTPHKVKQRDPFGPAPAKKPVEGEADPFS